MRGLWTRIAGGRLALMLASWSLVLVSVTLVGMAAVALVHEQRTLEGAFEAHWSETGRLASVMLAEALETDDRDLAERFGKSIAAGGTVHRLRVDAAGPGPDGVPGGSTTTFFDSAPGAPLGDLDDGYLPRDFADTNMMLSLTDGGPASEPSAVLVLPLRSGDRVIGLGRIEFSAEVRDARVAELPAQFLWLALGFIGLGLVGSLLLGRWISRPITELADLSRQIAGGDLARTCDLTRSDELGVLGRNFDDMVVRLRAARDELDGSHAHVESILGSMVDAVIVADREPGGEVVIRSVNRAAERALGYAGEDLVGRPVSLVLPEANLSGPGTTNGAARGPRPHQDTHLKRADGKTSPVRLSVSTLRDAEDEGGVQGLVLVASDVSEIQRAARLRATTYELSEAIHTAADMDQLFRTVHQVLQELMPAENFRIAVEDQAGDALRFVYLRDRFIDAVPPDAAEQGLTRHCMRNAAPLHLDREAVERLLRDGSVQCAGTLPHEWMGAPLRVDDRVVGAMVVQSYDEGIGFTREQHNLLAFVSEQLALAIERRRIAEERARLASAVEQAADEIIVSDSNGRIQFVNPAFVATTGYTREEAIGRNPFELTGSEEDAELHEEIQRLLVAGRSWSGRLKCMKQNGKPYEVDAAVSAVRDVHGDIVSFVSVQHDVTHEVALESQLRQAQKMEAIGQLAGGIAHDFNNLMSIITGYGEMLVVGIPEGSPDRMELDEIRKAAHRAVELTRQLLAFSRRQVMQARVLQLNDVVRELERMLRRLIGEDIDLRTDLAEGLERTTADPGQIQQVLMNLAVNARDAMPEGGQLTVGTSNTYLGRKYANSHADVEAGHYVLLSVTDTGTGMDGETLAQVFNPFFTTKEVGKGTGLGLSTVYGIVKQSGGHVSVYSELGVGTTFKVYLPQATEAEPLDTTEMPRTTDLRGTETILLTEDEEGVRNLTSRILQGYGYQVLVATHGEDALTIAAAHDEPIDLLITDVVMPRMSGRDLSETLRAERPDLRVLFMSGYASSAITRHGVLQPGQNFLEKPFLPPALGRAVRDLLDAPITCEVAREVNQPMS